MICHEARTEEEQFLLAEYVSWRHRNGYEPTLKQQKQIIRWKYLAEAAFGGSFLPFRILMFSEL